MFPHGSRQKKLLTGIRRTTGSGRRRFWELLKKTSREIYYLGVPSGGGQDVVGVEPEGNAPRMDEIDQEWRKMSGCSENHQQKGWLATRETGKEGGAKGREGVCEDDEILGEERERRRRNRKRWRYRTGANNFTTASEPVQRSR